VVGSVGYVNLQLLQIKAKLSALTPKCGNCILITIDGPAGSGKTTLAQSLAAELDSVSIIHMDDLYEGWGSTLTPNLTSKLRVLLETVRDNSKIVYEPYDWIIDSKTREISEVAPKFLLIEGVGSGQGAILEFVSLALWIEVPVEEGLARVLIRDGLAVAKYMPAFLLAQAAHFEKEGTRKRADYRLSGLATV